jgi:hypothetical protein
MAFMLPLALGGSDGWSGVNGRSGSAFLPGLCIKESNSGHGARFTFVMGRQLDKDKVPLCPK